MMKTDSIPTRNGLVDEKLMKPFFLGWTREVVKRVRAKNPTCDIYYLSPNGKKLRSINEIKSHLSHGLTPDCFLFKREILGVDINFETIRNARYKGQDLKTTKGRSKYKKSNKIEDQKPGPSGVKSKKRETEIKKSDLKRKYEENSEEIKKKQIKIKNKIFKNPVQKTSRDSHITKEKISNSALGKVQNSKGEREVFKHVMCKELRRTKMMPKKRVLRKDDEEVVTLNNKGTKKINDEETELKFKNENLLKRIDQLFAETETMSGSDEMFLRKRMQPIQSINTETESRNNKGESSFTKYEIQIKDKDNESTTSDDEEYENEDLKSIVQKNIGKYRKLREKQKLKMIKTQMKKSHQRVVNNSRAESFLKNRSNYIKPLQKGWRRELVYRSNCTKAGLQADVYYFHPNGKKFRSSREILENAGLIGGLPIEFFSFRKEAVGCGEPLEVIRKARTWLKN